MRTSKFTANGITYHIFHHGDWSGDAEIVYESPEAPEGARTVSVVLPGGLLKSCARQAAIEDVVSAVESAMESLMEDDDG